MCKDCEERASTTGNTLGYDNAKQAIGHRSESHTVYELKQRREYLIRQLLDIQNAIDAVNRLD